MRALAAKFGEDPEAWGIIGFLHDIDWEKTKANPAEHCLLAREILQAAGASEFLITTIQSHGWSNDSIPALKAKQRTTTLQYCLAAAETLTGLVVASALVRPDKKLASVSVKSLKDKFKTKSFAAKCDRNIILECEKAGIPLDEFLEIGLTAIQGISGELGL